MRIRVLTIGSDGDVRPYVALGVGLREAGHNVRIVAHRRFEALVRERGLEYAPVAGDHRDLEDNPQLRALYKNGRSSFHWFRAFNQVDAPLMRQRLRDCWEASSDAEVIVASLLPYLFGFAISRKLNVPLVRAFYYPVSPTRSYPAAFVPSWLGTSERMNLATYEWQRHLLWQVARPWIASACRDILGLSSLPRLEPFGELDRQQQLLLYAYSAAVAPPPPDWGPWINVTGYWFLERQADWTPPPALVEFLNDGPPPVCVSFGTMKNPGPAELIGIVSRALALTGQRAVLLTEPPESGMPELPRNLFAIDWVPVDWLFPRVTAVVHHGGAGTTAAGLRAGLPTIISPAFLDQFVWAKRVFELGVGPQPIPRKRLDADSLAAALRVVTGDAGMRDRAAKLGKRISAENGVARAVEVFEKHMKPAMLSKAAGG
jgi:UDP:flavonoid glycosyltransferase YjiC (YdhE family)